MFNHHFWAFLIIADLFQNCPEHNSSHTFSADWLTGRAVNGKPYKEKINHDTRQGSLMAQLDNCRVPTQEFQVRLPALPHTRMNFSTYHQAVDLCAISCSILTIFNLPDLINCEPREPHLH